MSRPRTAVLSTCARFCVHLCARWVLGAWLCVALASVFSPLARASGWELLCTASGESVWIASPAVPDGALPTGHGIDCPLCLPPLAPPPAQVRPLPASVAAVAPSAALPASIHLAALAGLPQARAPPR